MQPKAPAPIWRVGLRYAGEDPRVALRNDAAPERRGAGRPGGPARPVRPRLVATAPGPARPSRSSRPTRRAGRRTWLPSSAARPRRSSATCASSRSSGSPSRSRSATGCPHAVPRCSRASDPCRSARSRSGCAVTPREGGSHERHPGQAPAVRPPLQPGAGPVLRRVRAATDLRRRVLAGLKGTVVEVGAGDGANFPHYPDEVERIVAVEPEAYLREQASSHTDERVELRNAVATDLPVADGEADAVVCTLVLCSVDQAAALAEARRVLRSGGELRFLEHVRSHEPGAGRRGAAGAGRDRVAAALRRLPRLPRHRGGDRAGGVHASPSWSGSASPRAPAVPRPPRSSAAPYARDRAGETPRRSRPLAWLTGLCAPRPH